MTTTSLYWSRGLRQRSLPIRTGGSTESRYWLLIAAAFLGSTQIVPGKFNVWGSWAATYFLATGITGLQLMGYIGWVDEVFFGASLLVAVVIAALASRLRQR